MEIKHRQLLTKNKFQIGKGDRAKRLLDMQKIPSLISRSPIKGFQMEVDVKDCLESFALI